MLDSTPERATEEIVLIEPRQSISNRAALFFLLVLSACASAPELARDRAPVEGFALTARLGVRSAEQGFTGGLGWVHEAGADQLSITSPLGQTVAQIELAPGAAVLRLPERVLQAADLTELMEREMGWALPLQGLSDWVRARPRAGTPYDAEYDPGGRLALLRQDGWTIEYQRHFDEAPAARAKPQRLLLRHGVIELRLVIDRWAQE
ncbi:MAG: outer membrane lipoprotein LolB [Betaproteobacteria bacterium]|nr:outer membrane lipoprotein LolB [Betaproteobacteria bacterium]